jgi:hypothetical protein
MKMPDWSVPTALVHKHGFISLPLQQRREGIVDVEEGTVRRNPNTSNN